MKPKKILKIVAGVIIFFTLPSLLFFGFLYFKYNEELPVGSQPEKAEILAHKMLIALNSAAYDATNVLEWTFKNRHHYKWNKKENTCEVSWKNYKVILNLNNPNTNEVYIDKLKVEDSNNADLIKTATDYFNNDSFWLVAPYKVLDKGVSRSIVKHNGKDALLVAYNQGGSTPGDSYLWILDQDYKPTTFKMWVDILPIGGLEASWDSWKTTNTGAQLPTHHKLLFLGIELDNIKTSK